MRDLELIRKDHDPLREYSRIELTNGRVLVVGSANMDLVVRSPRHPGPGETILGGPFATFSGGKGANQAVAASRMGTQVALAGCVGDDVFGRQILNALDEEGIVRQFVNVESNSATGVAIITVDELGENTIVVAPGANATVTANQVATATQGFKPAVIIAQLEIPIAAVEAAAMFEGDAFFILNPAPAQALPAHLLSRVDLLTPNESELEILTGIKPDSPSALRTAADVLFQAGLRRVLVTLGVDGCVLFDPEEERFPAIRVDAVDTTAAGDAFNGALAALVAQGKTLKAAIPIASAAAAISVTRRGAQASLPTRQEVEVLMASAVS